MYKISDRWGKHSVNRIAIVGFRAVGKTTVGEVLAGLIGWNFADMDRILTERFGMSISEWVSLHGWESFRRKESELLQELSNLSRIVVATGGGIIERKLNVSLLEEKFYVVWLKADIKTVKKRIRSDKGSALNRPPLHGRDSISEVHYLLQKRAPLYQKVSNLTIFVENYLPSQIARIIDEKLQDTLNVPPV